MVKAHPWVGIGLGNFKPLMTRYADPEDKIDTIAHNTYIEVAAELGLPALIVFLAIFVAAYEALGQVRRRAPGPNLLHQAAFGMQAGLVGYAVSMFFLSAEYQKLLWLVIFLSMCLPPLARPAEPETSSCEPGDGASDQSRTPRTVTPDAIFAYRGQPEMTSRRARLRITTRESKRIPAPRSCRTPNLGQAAE